MKLSSMTTHSAMRTPRSMRAYLARPWFWSRWWANVKVVVGAVVIQQRFRVKE